MTNQRDINIGMLQKWWKQLFSIHELTEHSKSHPPWSNTQLENAQELAMQERRGCPAPLRIGPRNGHNDAVGSGLLITDGENYGILTAGSGGPIWAVQPTTGRPQLVGMVCSWDADETPEDRQRRAIRKLTGFRHEMFAHQIDSWFAQVATEMLTDVAHGRTHENRQGQTLIRTIVHPI